ncbi:hypothetical protein MNBD_GAMMA08-719 [hydrothermal vent metagenome]|uniref:START domain-containing protein n=1 Tax=hydrothermal vent metagenome TaxID=652676 RepID=A0A3B0XC46_9ZZZZ
MKNYLIWFLMASPFSTQAFSADKHNWQLVADENNIQVYVLNTDHSDIVKAKVKGRINAPLHKIKSIIDDIDHRHEWIPYLKISKALSEYQYNKRIEYSHFKTPWPASDRDFVYEIELVLETENKLIYKMASVESTLMPIDEDKIRADLFETVYTLTALDKENTAVMLTFHADPKGWVPNWIVNIIQRKFPYRILKNLNARLNGADREGVSANAHNDLE